MHRAALGLGLGTIVFGIAPALLPSQFARLCGIRASEDPTVMTAIRSVGIRDAVIGVGLSRAALSGQPTLLRQWLLARIASDIGDTVAVGLAVAAGVRDRRFLGLGALALGAASVGTWLLRAARGG
jgi:Domain of unknown function (DUF4267)